jgi:hypothetical protein
MPSGACVGAPTFPRAHQRMCPPSTHKSWLAHPVWSSQPTSAPGLHVHLSTGTHRGTAGVGVACAGAALLLILLLSYAPARDPRGRLDPL